MENTNDRRMHLMQLIANQGLEKIEINSELCLQYIYLGSGALYSPERIAELISQNRFLNEFCDHSAGLRLARDQCVSVKLPRDQWLQRVRRCMLRSSGYEDFPVVWPWNSEHGKTKSCDEDLHRRCYFDGVQGPRSSDWRVESQSSGPRSPKKGKRFRHFSKLPAEILLKSWRS